MRRRSDRARSTARTQALLMHPSPFLLAHEGAALLGYRGVEEVHARIDDGRWRAIDISCQWPRSEPHLRIYRYTALHELMRGTGYPVAPDLEALLPHLRPGCSRDEVAIFLRCHAKHIGHLTASGALRGPTVPEFTAAPLVDLIPITFRASLLQFLAEREVNGSKAPADAAIPARLI